MQRLMLLQIEASGCVAEAWLNGIAIARASPSQPRVDVPVHEYALAGGNRLELVIDPDGIANPLVAAADMAATARLLLARTGSLADASQSRTLAECAWTLAAGQGAPRPVQSLIEVDLPLAFPRWRWLDAPVVATAKTLQPQALALVQDLAAQLCRGQVDPFMALTRLRNEELALAYQRDSASEQARLRNALLHGHAAQSVQWPLPQLDAFRLRAVAGGRLLECLGADALPALRSAPDAQGRCWTLPLRLAWVENRFYVLR